MPPITRIHMDVAVRAIAGLCLAAAAGAAQAQEGSPQQPAPAEDSFDLDSLVEQGAPASAPVAEPAPPAEPQAAAAPEKEQGVVPVAQKEEAPAPALKDAPAHRQIEEIIVTATKREQSIRDIPASISAFSGESLEQQGKLGLMDFVEQSPGVVANAIAPGLMRISMRGISTDTGPLSGIPPPTGIFIGDTAFNDPYVSNIVPDLSAFDLSSVEILKGPQGTLFGGSALSGAIRYVLQDPVMGEVQARVFSQFVTVHEGSQAFTNGVALNVPLTEDSLALRVGYIKRAYPGTVDDTRNGKDDVDEGGGAQLRAILAWQPLDELRIKLTHIDQDFDADDASSASTNQEERVNGNHVITQPLVHAFTLDSAELRYDFQDVRAVSLTSLSTKDTTIYADGTSVLVGVPPQGYPEMLAAFSMITDDAEALAQEFRLQSTGPGDFQWLAGAYYYDYKVHFDLLIDTLAHQQLLGAGSLVESLLSGLGINSRPVYDETSLMWAVTDTKVKEKSLFFDLSYTLWDRLDVSAGARLYSTEVAGGFKGTGIVSRLSNNGMDINYSGNRMSENGVNPKLALTWHFSDDASLYAQAARGFRFGGLQSIPATESNGVPRAYKSDTLWNYELGLRTSWLENTLRFDVTLFYIDYQDPQIGQSTQAFFPLGYTDNVGSAVSRGFEASFFWLTPIPGVSLSLDGGITDAHITEEFEADDGTLVQSGAQLPGASESQYAASINFLAPLGSITLGSSLSYSYVGKGYSDIVHSIPINDYGTLNAGITIGSDAWRVKPRLGFNVSNILDEVALKGGSLGSSLTGIPVHTYLLNAPRTYTLRLSLDF